MFYQVLQYLLWELLVPTKLKVTAKTKKSIDGDRDEKIGVKEIPLPLENHHQI